MAAVASVTTIAGLTLPFLSESDPEQSGEGSLDPLRLVPIADGLAEEILPGVTNRMSRIRFLTAIAVSSAVSAGLEDLPPRDGVTTPYLAFEWHLVEAIARRRYGLPNSATRSVPGMSKARAVLAGGARLNASTYLKTPKVFGFVGIYKRLASQLGLVDRDQPAIARDRRKRAAGAYDRSAIGPIEQILGRGFAARRGVGEREDDRPLGIFGHHAYHLFGKYTRLTRNPYQHRRLCIVNDIEQTDLALLSKLPSRNGCTFLDERLLGGMKVGIAFDEKSVLVQGVYSVARLVLAQAGRFQHRDHQRGDADAG